MFLRAFSSRSHACWREGSDPRVGGSRPRRRPTRTPVGLAPRRIRAVSSTFDSAAAAAAPDMMTTMRPKETKTKMKQEMRRQKKRTSKTD
jgi:hypothetical protein